MPVQSKSDFTGFALLAITAVGWGLNWPAIKFVLADWPPLFSRGVAGTAAAVLLALLCVLRREGLRVPTAALAPLSAASFTNVFSWMGFTTIAMKYLSVAEASLLVYTMPIWVTLLSWPLLGARPTWKSGLALLLGCAGLVTLFSGHQMNFGAEKTLGIALCFAAAIFFALGSILNRRALPLSPVPLVTWQVGLACVPMMIIGFLFEHPNLNAMHAPGWYSLLYMALVPMGLCYVSWFGALRHLPAATAAIATLSVPVIGVISAAIALGEPLGLREIAAVVLTIAGVWLALGKPEKENSNIK
ncbi:MAG: DMT family transporter [Xanthobacteraceae bacterium]|nr:DMT family transporter [Xanthobacteraceae bacterium]MCW5674495.1 DMT family transporter [Xanthobacteraceae bacterium]